MSIDLTPEYDDSVERLLDEADTYARESNERYTLSEVMNRVRVTIESDR